MATVLIVGTGRSHMGKMDAIVTDSHLGTRNMGCTLMNVILRKLEYAGDECMGKEREVRQTAGSKSSR